MTSPAAFRVAYRELVLYRTMWRANMLAAFVQPLLYLLGIGFGVGTLVDKGPASTDLLAGVSYLAFYATALPATTAMFTSSQQALWPTMDGFQWSNAYRAMMATPLQPIDLATGLALYFATRVTIGSTGVAAALMLFDDTRAWGLVGVIPSAVVTGLAFAMPIAAWTATRSTDASFTLILRFGLVPMFLFGGAFYPISQLPDILRPIAMVTPLWHGVELCRGWVLGGTSATTMAMHALVLAGFAGGGWAMCTITFARRLRQ